jgi:hypothetical protein
MRFFRRVHPHVYQGLILLVYPALERQKGVFVRGPSLEQHEMRRTA